MLTPYLQRQHSQLREAALGYGHRERPPGEATALSIAGGTARGHEDTAAVTAAVRVFGVWVCPHAGDRLRRCGLGCWVLSLLHQCRASP